MTAASADSPRVAYLFARFPIVSQTFCDTEMLALEALGFHLTIASLFQAPDSFRHERLRGLRAEVIYPPPKPVLEMVLREPPDDPVWRAMEALAADHETRYGADHTPLMRARNAWYFAGELRRRGISHVHLHFANSATHTALFLKKAGLTYSFTAHAQDFMIDLGNDDLLREMIREAAFTVAVSDFSRELLVRVCPDAESRIHRVYNGIDAPQFPRASPGESGRLKIVSVGRLIDFKGFPVLLEAAARLLARGIDFEAVIIGEGPQRPVLEEKIRTLGLADRVRLAGVRSQEEIKRELAAAGVFSLACLTDGKGAMDILPTVMLEAMACGLPIVSTTLAGVPEIVVHGVTGLLTEPENAEGLADHLITLALDPALRARMGAAGYERVREVFALEKTAGHLAQRLLPWLSGKDSAPPPPEDLLCLLDTGTPPNAALERELDFLMKSPAVTVMATRQGMAPAGCEYLPDALVIESHWRSRPDLVARAEALRADLGSVEGDAFYEAARRAVYLTVQAPIRGWRRVHAVRAAGALTAWLLHRLSGLPAGVTIESDHRESRTVLKKLAGAFTWGSNSDTKLKTPLLPDLLKLRIKPPKPPRRVLWVFKKRPAPARIVEPAPVWESWLRLPEEDKGSGVQDSGKPSPP
ncbi:MAG: glycosyltransferase family 4 protein [Verrucomicrobiota bacterium]